MIEKIMKKLGYRKLSSIEIQDKFKTHPPIQEKLELREYIYNYTGKFVVPIVLEGNLLVDGYTTYLIAKKHNKKYIKVEEN